LSRREIPWIQKTGFPAIVAFFPTPGSFGTLPVESIPWTVGGIRGTSRTVVTRVLDLAVLALLAIAILMPRPDVKVKPALAENFPVRQRVAELQAQLVGSPGDSAAALELAGIFMDVAHPEWALAALDSALAAHPDDHRLHLARSLAFIDHFEAGYAYAEAMRAVTLCESGSAVPCDEADHGRMVILKTTLDRIKHMDIRRDPNSAKEQIIKGLRSTFVPRAKLDKPADRPARKAAADPPGAK
jgi:hypothetical protein